MYEQLPELIRKEVQAHLEDNNFPAAKRLYDQWKTGAHRTTMTTANARIATNLHKDEINA